VGAAFSRDKRFNGRIRSRLKAAPTLKEGFEPDGRKFLIKLISKPTLGNHD
jgi:hypothetical protein